MRLVTPMVGELNVESPVDQPLGQMAQQPARPNDRFLLLLAPANSSSTTSSRSWRRMSSGTRATIPGGGAGGLPSGSPPAPCRLETG